MNLSKGTSVEIKFLKTKCTVSYLSPYMADSREPLVERQRPKRMYWVKKYDFHLMLQQNSPWVDSSATKCNIFSTICKFEGLLTCTRIHTDGFKVFGDFNSNIAPEKKRLILYFIEMYDYSGECFLLCIIWKLVV